MSWFKRGDTVSVPVKPSHWTAILKTRDGFEKRLAIQHLVQTINCEKIRPLEAIASWATDHNTNMALERTCFEYESADGNKKEAIYLEAYSPPTNPKSMANIYNCEQLKGIIRKGDTVRAVPGKNNECGELRGDGSNVQLITFVGPTHFSINDCNHSYARTMFLEIVSRNTELAQDNIQVGDSIIDEDGDAYGNVMGICGNLVALSEAYDHTDLSEWVSIQSLVDGGYKLDLPKLTAPKPDEVTMADVIAKFGRNVVIKKE